MSFTKAKELQAWYIYTHRRAHTLPVVFVRCGLGTRDSKRKCAEWQNNSVCQEILKLLQTLELSWTQQQDPVSSHFCPTLTNESQITTEVDYFVTSGYLWQRHLRWPDGASLTQNAVQRPCTAWGRGGIPWGSHILLPREYRLIDLGFNPASLSRYCGVARSVLLSDTGWLTADAAHGGVREGGPVCAPRLP